MLHRNRPASKTTCSFSNGKVNLGLTDWGLNCILHQFRGLQSRAPEASPEERSRRRPRRAAPPPFKAPRRCGVVRERLGRASGQPPPLPHYLGSRLSTRAAMAAAGAIDRRHGVSGTPGNGGRAHARGRRRRAGLRSPQTAPSPHRGVWGDVAFSGLLARSEGQSPLQGPPLARSAALTYVRRPGGGRRFPPQEPVRSARRLTRVCNRGCGPLAPVVWRVLTLTRSRPKGCCSPPWIRAGRWEHEVRLKQITQYVAIT